jgi:RNA polymerase sigma-70 factor (ECF subfamily)
MLGARPTPIHGDRFEAAYRTDGARVWRSVLLFAGDPEVASDAVAEAFAQAIRRGDEILDPIAWVTRAAFRIAAGELQSRRRTDYRIIEEGYELPEPAHELAAALARLSPKQRAAAVLHLRDGYTLAETAEIIGSTTAAVGVHVHRAKARLRTILGDHDG